MPEETTPPPSGGKPDDKTPPPGPPADADAGLGELIERKVREAFAAALGGGKPAEPAPPAAPAGGGKPAEPAAPAASSAPAGAGGDIAAAIESAVARALGERDREDQLAVLGKEIADLKAAAARRARPGWGAFLLGPGLPR